MSTDDELERLLAIYERGFRAEAARHDLPQSAVDDMLDIIRPRFEALLNGENVHKIIIDMGIAMLKGQILARAYSDALMDLIDRDTLLALLGAAAPKIH